MLIILCRFKSGKRVFIMGRKWNNIKEKKASKDANTSRIYAKFGVEIYVAARSGEPNPESNQALKFVLERAKTYQDILLTVRLIKQKADQKKAIQSFVMKALVQMAQWSLSMP